MSQTEITTQIELSEIVDALSSPELKDRIEQLDAVILSGEQVDCPIQHEFIDGMYIRERMIPMGTLFTTYTWKHEHPYFCNLGELMIFDVTTGEWSHFIAPCRGITKAGTKRIVYAITDVVWTTCHANPDNVTDVAEMEHILLEKYSNRFIPLNKLKELQK
jgi:hypothetical protein